ncbi:MAG: 3-deoxy-manno-octulosonate-8-phosphatase KdsC [Gammaproteobacteria bacterium]|nr:MAG: 3-deoxy-manno-octulosonate-8-phosphatase KdsC [Gammaproteobacteria bacterium]
MTAQARLAGTRLVAFDIDGVFTDGRFYLSDAGVESKAFCTQDGYGVRRLLEAGIEVAVISGRRSEAVTRRMQELGVAHVVQGCGDKLAAFQTLTETLGLGAADCVFVGDDLPDLPLLRQAGVAIAVANAVAEVKAACDLTTAAAGGCGAVREVCDLVLEATGRG